jgi:hypothetical protein
MVAIVSSARATASMPQIYAAASANATTFPPFAPGMMLQYAATAFGFTNYRSSAAPRQASGLTGWRLRAGCFVPDRPISFTKSRNPRRVPLLIRR